jgi:hypothetical protein
MVDKENQKKIKQLKKKIDNSKKLLEKVEFRPCKGDADIIQRENEVEDLKSFIRSLVIERDQHIYT